MNLPIKWSAVCAAEHGAVGMFTQQIRVETSFLQWQDHDDGSTRHHRDSGVLYESGGNQAD